MLHLSTSQGKVDILRPSERLNCPPIRGLKRLQLSLRISILLLSERGKRSQHGRPVPCSEEFVDQYVWLDDRLNEATILPTFYGGLMAL